MENTGKTYILADMEDIEELKEDINELEDLIELDGNSVTSWNDLEDRPFYTQISQRDILPEQTLTVYDGNYTYGETDYATLVAGEDYVVRFDGTEYITKATWDDDKGCYFLGNIDVVEDPHSLGIPFAIYIYPNWYMMEIYMRYAIDVTREEVNLGISGPIEEYATLDSKYLPPIPEDKLPQIPSYLIPSVSLAAIPNIPENKLPEKTLLWNKIYDNNISAVIMNTSNINMDVSFSTNAISYYLVSEDIPDIDVNKTYCTRRQLPDRIQSLRFKPTVIGDFISMGYANIAKSAGTLIDKRGAEVEVPKAGIYFQENALDLGEIIPGTAVLNTQTYCILNSSTEGSSKKFALSIDDDGNLKTIEVVEYTP